MKRGKRNKIVAFVCVLLVGISSLADSVTAVAADQTMQQLQQSQQQQTGDIRSCEWIEVPDDVVLETEPEPEGDADAEEEAATGSAEAWKQYRSNYTYNKLSTEEKKLYRRLDTQCMKALTSKTDYYYYFLSGISYLPCVSMGSLSKQRAREVYEIFFLSNPQYYFLSNQILYSNSKKEVAACVSNQYREGTARYNTTSKIKKKLNTWNTLIAKEKTDLAKEKKAHDIIVKATVYDTNSMNMMDNQQIDSVILNGKSVCAGYSQLFQMLCNKAGITTICVTSKIHQWNKIKLYGYWYNVDCTWDDVDGYLGKQCTYDYFNRSDTQMRSEKLEQNNSHEEESFWKGISPTAKLDSGGSYSKVPKKSTAKKTCTIKASNVSKVYGKNQSFQLKVTATKGSGTLTYNSSDKNIIEVSKNGKCVIKGCGKATVTIQTAANETYKAAKKKITVSICPVKQKITKLQKKTANSIKVSFKQDKKASGYQIKFSQRADFKSSQTVLVKTNKVTNQVLKKLEKNRTYYIKVRSYKTIQSDKVWGNWSVTKSITV